MSTFETSLKFWCGPLSGGGPRRLPHLSHSKSAPVFKYFTERKTCQKFNLHSYYNDEKATVRQRCLMLVVL